MFDPKVAIVNQARLGKHSGHPSAAGIGFSRRGTGRIRLIRLTTESV
ncbi:hypothetical protein O9993_15245 [Vibrio lentus]|nr:hypothetical protein [Vibrio lentus]